MGRKIWVFLEHIFLKIEFPNVFGRKRMVNVTLWTRSIVQSWIRCNANKTAHFLETCMRGAPAPKWRGFLKRFRNPLRRGRRSLKHLQWYTEERANSSQRLALLIGRRYMSGNSEGVVVWRSWCCGGVGVLAVVLFVLFVLFVSKHASFIQFKIWNVTVNEKDWKWWKELKVLKHFKT